ncbi:MAG: hypothetical protein E7673_01975 [Ruminococcaceae bacterium]|nr:hypothetical protein [Oscillospiraceae bacterium]
MKKILSLTLICVLFLLSLASCSKKPIFEDVKYEENGLSFYLPNTMQRELSEDYEFYFSGRTMNVIFSAMKITDEFLEKVELEVGTTAEKYVDAIIERRGLDKSMLYYTHYEESGQYNFRYNYVSENNFETFFYVTVLGTPDNMWYVEMCCPNDESGQYLEMFEGWRKSLRTY